MKWTTLKAGELLPDQPDLDNPGVIVAENMVPHATGYLPLSATAVYTVATGTSNTDFIRGSFHTRDRAGNNHVYAGDAGNLYELTAGAAWANVSKATKYSGTTTQEVWNFAEWGNTVLACKYGNKPQEITASSGAAVFADLTGAPEARYIMVVRDFVVLGGLRESSVEYPMRLRWSAYNNSKLWTQSRATQSDFQDLPDGGKITGLGGGESGIIWQESAIRLMSYYAPTIFRFDVLDSKHGCRLSRSIVRHRNEYFYISDEDVYRIQVGGAPQPLGAQKYIRKFWSEFNEIYSYRMSAAVDPKRHIVMWAYPTNTGTGAPDKILIWNWDTGKFSTASLSAQSLFYFNSLGYTLDGLDAVTTNIDNLAISLDSSIWDAGTGTLGGFDANNRLFTFTGSPMTGTVETGEIRAAPGRFLEITNTRPLVEGGTARVQIGTRASQGVSSTWTGYVEPNASGECNIRTNSRFARARIEASGNWTNLLGVDINVRAGGTR